MADSTAPDGARSLCSAGRRPQGWRDDRIGPDPARGDLSSGADGADWALGGDPVGSGQVPENRRPTACPITCELPATAWS
jgi:hypothetical protein